MLKAGDKVVAIMVAGRDRHGLPLQVPVIGQPYTITEVYAGLYGLGCNLEGLDPWPYQGYLLRVDRKWKRAKRGWHFMRKEVYDKRFTIQKERTDGH